MVVSILVLSQGIAFGNIIDLLAMENYYFRSRPCGSPKNPKLSSLMLSPTIENPHFFWRELEHFYGAEKQ